MILDTTFIIDLLRGNQAAITKAEELLKRNEPIRATTVSVFEIWQGAEDINNPIKKEKIDKFISSVGFVILDIESAKKAGSIFASLKSQGLLIEGADCMIAGITLTNNEVLLTRNKKHFERIKDLKIESY